MEFGDPYVKYQHEVPMFIPFNLVGGSREGLPPPNRTARTGQVSRSSISD